MSADSLAISRRHAGSDLEALAQQHLQHDLTPSDRDSLESAARKIAVHTTLGSLAGVALGAALFMRTRRARGKLVATLSKPAARPVEVRFQDGRVEPLPELPSLLAPTPLTDAAGAFFFLAGGLFVGGELGVLTGTWGARRTLARDPEAEKRIENAFRRFRADVLRKQAEALEEKAGGKTGSILESAKELVGGK